MPCTLSSENEPDSSGLVPALTISQSRFSTDFRHSREALCPPLCRKLCPPATEKTKRVLITVDSEEGAFTEFTVRLPRVRRAAAEA